MPDKSIREKMTNYFYAYAGSRDEEIIDQALTAIRQAIKDEIDKLPLDHFIYPKEWDGLKKIDVDTAIDKLFGIKKPCCWRCGKEGDFAGQVCESCFNKMEKKHEQEIQEGEVSNGPK